VLALGLFFNVEVFGLFHQGFVSLGFCFTVVWNCSLSTILYSFCVCFQCSWESQFKQGVVLVLGWLFDVVGHRSLIKVWC
jgi:hypothetical protein